MSRKKTQEEFVEELRAINNRIEIIGTYEGTNKKIKSRCLTCGHIWEPRAADILNGHGCPECSHPSKRRTQEEFENRLNQINPYIKVMGKYVNNNTKITCKCLICNNEWSQKPNALLNRRGCPECNHTSTSFIEQCILFYFIDLLGEEEVISRDRAAIGLELDIYIPSINVAIEYGSWYWHKHTKQRDKEKERRCQEKGINLYCILDSLQGDKVDHLNKCYSFDNSLSDEDNLTSLKSLLEDISIANNIVVDECIDWGDIVNKAYLSSRRKTKYEFETNVLTNNPQIELIGEYKGSSNKIQVKCRKCGYVWSANPYSIEYGKRGCPKCNHRINRNKDEFLIYLHEKNPQLIYIDGYTKVHDTITIKCAICGKVWRTKAYTLLSGHGCPNCSHPSEKKTNEAFVAELKRIRPDISPLEEYQGKDEKIGFKCNKCGYEWKASPHSVFYSKNCPKCWEQLKGKKRRLSNEDFLNRVYSLEKEIDVIGEYSGVRNTITIKCRKCQKQWDVLAGSLLKGYIKHNCHII